MAKEQFPGSSVQRGWGRARYHDLINRAKQTAERDVVTARFSNDRMCGLCKQLTVRSMQAQIYCEPVLLASGNTWSKCKANSQDYASLGMAAAAGSARPLITDVNERIDPRHTRKMLICSECHGLRFMNTKMHYDLNGKFMCEELLEPSANLHHIGEVSIHVDPTPSLSGHPIERRFAETNADWQSWARKSFESKPTTQQRFNYADRVTRLLRQELLSGSTAVTKAFWTTCVSPPSAMVMMMKLK